ncbi:hypothetical protein N7G274_009286 [Stereocaulon virgatum]|uniref:Uncharacterized protein n=1 Tax=Stereocaulon virgatum TaxID=373712 RepID=A0ABR3ZYJ2_9LECA
MILLSTSLRRISDCVTTGVNSGVDDTRCPSLRTVRGAIEAFHPLSSFIIDILHILDSKFLPILSTSRTPTPSSLNKDFLQGISALTLLISNQITIGNQKFSQKDSPAIRESSSTPPSSSIHYDGVLYLR